MRLEAGWCAMTWARARSNGSGSFRWSVAEAALDQGWLPDVISTDLHAFNLHGPISLGPNGLPNGSGKNRIYFGYGTSSQGVLQIVDRDKLLND